MAAHLPLRSSFDGFLAVAAFAALPLKPAPASADGVAADEPSNAPTDWGAPRSSTDDAATKRHGGRRAANLRPRATAGVRAFRLQIIAEREGG